MTGHEMVVDESPDVRCTCGAFEAPNDPDRLDAFDEHLDEVWSTEDQPEFTGVYA